MLKIGKIYVSSVEILRLVVSIEVLDLPSQEL